MKLSRASLDADQDSNSSLNVLETRPMFASEKSYKCKQQSPRSELRADYSKTLLGANNLENFVDAF